MEVVNCSDETLLKIRALYKADDNGCERVVVVVGDVVGGGGRSCFTVFWFTAKLSRK